MKRALSILLITAVIFGSVYAGFYPKSPDARIQMNDTAGNGKLVLGANIGDGSNAFYKGTIDVSDAYLDRRIETVAGTEVIYLQQATVVTGTSRAYMSAQYQNEAAGADALDRYLMVSGGKSNFARFEPGQEIRELVVGDGTSPVGTAYIQGAPFFYKPIRIGNIGAAGPSHIIRWGLTGKLNQQIQLPTLAGAVTSTTQFILDNDLELDDDVAFLPSTSNNPFDAPDLLITFSNSKFALGGEDLTWRSSLLLEKAQDVELNANLNLDATWLFSGNAMIQGNGNILDLSGRDANTNGTIGVDISSMINNSNTTTIFLRDIKLRLRNGALFLHERNVLDLSNVEIELENTVNFTSGNIRISGPTMIYAKNYTFSVSNGATMTVDGTVLYYDSGQHYNKQGVFPNDVLDDDKTTMGEALNFQHDGYIQMIQKPEVTLIVSPGGVSGQPTGNIDSGSGTSGAPYQFTSDKDKWLSDDVQLIFDNTSNTGNERYYVYNGDNHFLQLAREANSIVLHTNTRVYFVNTVFKDFDPTAIKLDGSGSSKAQIFFGQGTVLEFGQDVELGTGSDSLYTLTFRLENVMLTPGAGTPGNENIVKIAGQGHRLSLPYASGQSTPGQIVVDDQGGGKGVRLEFEDLAIEQLGGWPRRFELEHNTAQIYSLQHTNTILYRNAKLNLSDNYSYTQANMFIDGTVNIDTHHDLDVVDLNVAGADPTVHFIFQPMRQATLTVSHNARLVIGQNVTFSLDPIVTETTMAGMRVNGGVPFSGGTTGNVQYDKPHKSIVFEDRSSTIHMNGSTLHVTGTGLNFGSSGFLGAIDIENNVTWFVGTETHGNDNNKITVLQIPPNPGVTINLYAGATLDIDGPVHYGE